jgi:hypothetical protein
MKTPIMQQSPELAALIDEVYGDTIATRVLMRELAISIARKHTGLDALARKKRDLTLPDMTWTRRETDARRIITALLRAGLGEGASRIVPDLLGMTEGTYYRLNHQHAFYFRTDKSYREMADAAAREFSRRLPEIPR